MDSPTQFEVFFLKPPGYENPTAYGIPNFFIVCPCHLKDRSHDRQISIETFGKAPFQQWIAESLRIIPVRCIGKARPGKKPGQHPVQQACLVAGFHQLGRLVGKITEMFVFMGCLDKTPDCFLI